MDTNTDAQNVVAPAADEVVVETTVSENVEAAPVADEAAGTAEASPATE